MNKLKIKSMPICFFDCKSMNHKEFVPEGQKVNNTFTEKISSISKHQEQYYWVLHYDNASCYTATSINEFLASSSDWNPVTFSQD